VTERTLFSCQASNLVLQSSLCELRRVLWLFDCAEHKNSYLQCGSCCTFVMRLLHARNTSCIILCWDHKRVGWVREGERTGTGEGKLTQPQIVSMAFILQ
jgi:hypothetical protein